MVTQDIRYIGVDDKTLDLFEGQYPIPNGIAYNSYLILDDKVAVMDTVDKRKTAEYLDNLERELAGRSPDYLVVTHVERTTPPVSGRWWTGTRASGWWAMPKPFRCCRSISTWT